MFKKYKATSRHELFCMISKSFFLINLENHLLLIEIKKIRLE